MAVKRFRPLTPGLRFKVANTFEELTSSTPEKSLMVPVKRTGGRNNRGKMTMRYIGGGHKKMYRIIDFKRNKFDIPATVKSVEYDPNRSAFIALLHYADGEKRYILAPKGIEVGQTLMSGAKATPDTGNALFLSSIPLGSSIHNVEVQPGKGGQLVRTAGASATLAARDGKYAIVKLPSGETRMILQSCLATMGELSNEDHLLEVSGKAGRSRWLGRRPRVRGVAMNPVDHPMGGGEGRASGGHPRSRTGKLAKGFKTRAPKKASDKVIVKRRKG
ncbi:MAG: 50S ribosomal protein L2 [Bacteroidia bacterium]